jgi:hypothetical protein
MLPKADDCIIRSADTKECHTTLEFEVRQIWVESRCNFEVGERPLPVAVEAAKLRARKMQTGCGRAVRFRRCRNIAVEPGNPVQQIAISATIPQYEQAKQSRDQREAGPEISFRTAQAIASSIVERSIQSHPRVSDASSGVWGSPSPEGVI